MAVWTCATLVWDTSHKQLVCDTTSRKTDGICKRLKILLFPIKQEKHGNINIMKWKWGRVVFLILKHRVALIKGKKIMFSNWTFCLKPRDSKCGNFIWKTKVYFCHYSHQRLLDHSSLRNFYFHLPSSKVSKNNTTNTKMVNSISFYSCIGWLVF